LSLSGDVGLSDDSGGVSPSDDAGLSGSASLSDDAGRGNDV
jgi:hypothetical protein